MDIEIIKYAETNVFDFKLLKSKDWLTDFNFEAIKWSALFANYLQDPFLYEYKNGIKTRKTNDRNFNIKVPELKTSQMRKFFGALRQFEAKLDPHSKNDFPSNDLKLLIPKLAYAAGRETNRDAKIKDFFKIISLQIEQVSDYKSFSNLMKMLETIVAFHKYFGGE